MDDEADRRRRIANAAYLRAERRGFSGGSELDDWLEAEREIDSMAGKGGAAAESATARDQADAAPTETIPAADARVPPEKVKTVANRLHVSARRLREAIFREGPRLRDVVRGLEEDDKRGNRPH